MATMHPSTISKAGRPLSEVKFFDACKEQLNEKYHVFYSLRWYTTTDGVREDSECDFLIFNPDYGFLCVEVKGGTGISVEDGKWYLEDKDGGRQLKRSPYKQAEQSMWYFKKYYEEELEIKYRGIYGCAAAFPNFVINEPLTVESPMETTIDLNNMDNLQKRIVEIFRYFKIRNYGESSFFAPDSQEKFIKLINKRIALSICAGALIQDKEKELSEINRTQDTVIDLLTHYPRAFIIGGAGTGKTWIGLKKIKRFVLSDCLSLYLCNNPVLANQAKEIVNDDRAECKTLEQLAKDILKDKYDLAPIRDGCKEYSTLFEKENGLNKYDLIVVDEAQDFTEDWAYCVNLLLKDGGSLYVLFDESQNIFERSFGDKFYIDTRPFVLRYNIRNTANIYRFTQETTSLGLDTITNQVEGVEPDKRVFTKKAQAISFIDSTINKLVNREGVSPASIVILSDREKEKSILDKVSEVGGYKLGNNDGIKFETVSDFKGLESDIIIFINHTYQNAPNTEKNKAMLYTAMTRARFYLFDVVYEEKVDMY